MTNAAGSADAVGSGTYERLGADLRAALRRRPAQEARLAGVTRALAPFSNALTSELVSVLDTMVRRGSYDRPLYGAIVRTLAEIDDSAQVAALIGRALTNDESGSLSTLSAACFCRNAGLRESLARAAISRHAHIAFAAEVARLSRGESDGATVASLAPKIKESHRIALCVELLAPLLGGPALPRAIAPALAVLRDAERHLGRWLVLAEIAVRSGDPDPREQARERARSGPESARAAWSLVLWALEPAGDSPNVRPTVELVARLSERPSADKDTTFLFRLAGARVASARPMLESLAKTSMLGDDCAIRAMLHLSRDYGEARYRDQLADVVRAPRRDVLRGLAAACLYDSGEIERALDVASNLEDSRHLPALAWSLLIRARHAAAFESTIVTEERYRRVQLGWVE
jgi:hypothetical protein